MHRTRIAVAGAGTIGRAHIAAARTGATVQLAVQNLADHPYRSFPGVPTLGRMALLRLKYGF